MNTPQPPGSPAGRGPDTDRPPVGWPVDVLAVRPMRTPPSSWGLLVTHLETRPGTEPDPGADGTEIALLRMSGYWLREPPGGPSKQADHDGQIVIRPRECDMGAGADVTAWLATAGRWHLIGSWPGIGPDWPEHLAPTLLTVRTLTRHPTLSR
jgi:hypothetical protein